MSIADLLFGFNFVASGFWRYGRHFVALFEWLDHLLSTRNQSGLPAGSLAHVAWDYGRARRYPIREKGQAGIVSWTWIAATILRHDNALFLRTSSNSHYPDDYVIDRYGVNIA